MRKNEKIKHKHPKTGTAEPLYAVIFGIMSFVRTLADPSFLGETGFQGFLTYMVLTPVAFVFAIVALVMGWRSLQRLWLAGWPDKTALTLSIVAICLGVLGLFQMKLLALLL